MCGSRETFQAKERKKRYENIIIVMNRLPKKTIHNQQAIPQIFKGGNIEEITNF